MTANSPFGQHMASLNRNELMELLAARHSVRRYADRPIEGEKIALLREEIDACNERLGLSAQLCLDNPEVFDGRLTHYGSFSGVRNHVALIGPAGADLDQRCGRAGERIVLLAQALGLNTCWVAMSYRRRASFARVGAGERYVCCLVVGHGEGAGSPHKIKPVEKLGCMRGADGLDGAPAWFLAGLEAARLAPTAMNQQRFRFELEADGRHVRARALPAISCGHIDLGIAKLHFELGASAVSNDWAFA